MMKARLAFALLLCGEELQILSISFSFEILFGNES